MGQSDGCPIFVIEQQWKKREGEMETKDLNRGICSIEYNCLNLHLLVEFTVI